MTEKVILVTDPDDTHENGFRLLLVDLSVEQSDLVSKALTTLNTDTTIIVYNYPLQDKVEWLLDKMRKCDKIIFNADSIDQTLVGYFSSYDNASYFGNLRSLNKVNTSVVYDTESCKQILEKAIDYYGKS
jgi:hypothetical protein